MFGLSRNVIKVCWNVFLFALVVFIAWKVSSTVLVVIFAVFFSYLLHPLIQFAENHLPKRVPRIAVITLVFVVVIVLMAVFGSLLGEQIQEQAIALSRQLPELLSGPNIINRLPLPDFMEPMRERVIETIRNQFQSTSTDALPAVQQLGLHVMHAAGNLIYVVLVPILSFLLIKDAPMLRSEFLAHLSGGHKKLWSGIVKDLDVLLAGYVRALLLLAIAAFICYGIGFTVLGVPYSLLLAGIAAVLEFVPVIGPLAAAVVAVAVAGFSGYDHLIWLIAFIAVYRIFQDYVLNPYLMSEGVEVSPFLVIVGLLAGEQLGGVTGIFLAVPVMAALKIVIVRGQASRKGQAVSPAQQPLVEQMKRAEHQENSSLTNPGT